VVRNDVREVASTMFDAASHYRTECSVGETQEAKTRANRRFVASDSVGWALLPVVSATKVGQECPTYIQSVTSRLGASPGCPAVEKEPGQGPVEKEPGLAPKRLMNNLG
jgi:hypothetical protein